MEEILEIFRNNIFCRRESNQRKARKCWSFLSSFITERQKVLFEIEWGHYLIGDISIGGLAWHIDKFEYLVKESAKNYKGIDKNCIGIEVTRVENPHRLIVKPKWNKAPSKH